MLEIWSAIKGTDSFYYRMCRHRWVSSQCCLKGLTAVPQSKVSLLERPSRSGSNNNSRCGMWRRPANDPRPLIHFFFSRIWNSQSLRLRRFGILAQCSSGGAEAQWGRVACLNFAVDLCQKPPDCSDQVESTKRWMCWCCDSLWMHVLTGCIRIPNKNQHGAIYRICATTQIPICVATVCTGSDSAHPGQYSFYSA